MSNMTDPMNALKQLQIALDKRVVQLTPCEIYRDLSVIIDQPNGKSRFTYVFMENGLVQAVSLFVLAELVEGIPCFNVGYAVVENKRGKGLGTKVLKQGVDELLNGSRRNGIPEFYIEAIVYETNDPSNKLAKKVISEAPESITDCFSGEAAFHYIRKVK